MKPFLLISLKSEIAVGVRHSDMKRGFAFIKVMPFEINSLQYGIIIVNYCFQCNPGNV